MSKIRTLFYGWTIVAACFGINAIVHGIRYSYGVFFKSLSGEFILNRATTSGISALYWILCGGFGLIGGFLLDKYGARKIILVMGILTGVSLIATSLATDEWQLFLAYSLLLSAGTGAVYSVIMTTTQRWFIRQRGIAIGIVSSGVGIGTIIMNPLMAFLIESFSWRTAFAAAGMVLGSIFAVLSIPLKNKPADTGLLPDGEEQTSVKLAEINRTTDSNSLSLHEALHSTNYRLLAAVWFLWAIALLLVLTHLVPHLTDIGVSSTLAATFNGLIGVFSIPGRLITGWLCDKTDRKVVTVVAITALVGSLLLLAWSRQIWQFYIFVFIFGFAYGSMDPATLALITDICGTRYLGRIMGSLILCWAAGAGIGSLAGGLIYDAAGSYFLAFLLCAFLTAVAGICTIMIKRK